MAGDVAADAQVVRAMIGSWNSGDRDPARLAMYLDPAIELASPLASVSGEPYRGFAGIEQWMRDLDEQFEEWIMCPDEVRQVGHRVLVRATIKARGRASGAALEFPSASVSDFMSDHRVIRIRIYLDLSDALEAVGLDE